MSIGRSISPGLVVSLGGWDAGGMAPFKGPPPSAYVILQNGAAEVYRFPETKDWR
jgi:hypothetical protein